MRLYHRTTPDGAQEILSARRFVSKENTQEVYFSNRSVGHAEGYGTAAVVAAVPDELAELDDEFPDGERHYRVRVDRIEPWMIVAVVQDLCIRCNQPAHGGDCARKVTVR